MNKFKRTVSLMLVLITIISVMIVPASALSSRWSSEFATFPTLRRSNSGSHPGYTKALQRFLMCYDDNFKRVLEQNGGMDGKFGRNTEDVVTAYQIAEGITNDGIVGSGTWTQIASNMSISDTNYQRYIFSVRGKPVIWVDRVMYPTYTYLYYTTDDYAYDVFHSE